MNYFLRIFLWVCGIYLLGVLVKGLDLGLGLATQAVFLLWVCVIYFDAKQHEFRFVS